MTANLLAVRTLSQSVARSELLTAHETLTHSKLDAMERQYNKVVRLNIAKDLTIDYLKKELDGYLSPQHPTLKLSQIYTSSSKPPASSSFSPLPHIAEDDWNDIDDQFYDNKSMQLADGDDIVSQIIGTTPSKASLKKEDDKQPEQKYDLE